LLIREALPAAFCASSRKLKAPEWGGQVVDGQFKITRHDIELIVKVMRNGSCHTAQAFSLLYLL
jgi:hypothetical protein